MGRSPVMAVTVGVEADRATGSALLQNLGREGTPARLSGRCRRRPQAPNQQLRRAMRAATSDRAVVMVFELTMSPVEALIDQMSASTLIRAAAAIENTGR